MAPGESETRAVSERPASGRRWGFVVIPLLIFAALAVMFSYALKTGDPSKLPSALIGKAVPQMALPALDGLVRDGKAVAGFDPTTLAGGEVALVNFFASWCVPCVQEHPMLMALAEREKLPIHGINYKDPAPGGLGFITRHGNPYRSVGVDTNGRAAIEWGVYGMPETFVIDGQGRIIFKQVGPLTPAIVEAVLLPLIKKARAGG